MPKAPKLEMLAARVAAKRIAESEGRKWKDMSADERSALRTASQDKITPDDRKKALLRLAKKTAEKDGKDWKTLPKEQRKSILQKFKQPGTAKRAKKAKQPK